MSNVLSHIIEQKNRGKKILAVLIDPDKTSHLPQLLEIARTDPPDLFLFGGSGNIINFEEKLKELRSSTNVPVVIFPGNNAQISKNADGILLLSLLSGRNPDHLIGQHVNAAFALEASGLEIIPTGYILIDGGKKSTTATLTGTSHLDHDDVRLISSTALAGQQLGMKMIYLEAGSGAPNPLPVQLISQIRKTISVPLIAGGGIKSAEEITERFDAGADFIVVGNILEHKPAL
ncbi:MAG TPA: phosphoglycerol geranylgeranyltransferase, partial [Bacteroidia bacterium]|nr:phosphoglycerol geranylgeranyltransferase [Bacteroidia bacterium]